MAWTVHEVAATVEAPVDEVPEKLGGWAKATPIDENSCAVRILTSDLDRALFALAALHAPFTIQGPEEAITRTEEWGRRLSSAARPDV